ncbi:MAG: SDR family oxidoreductase [Fibrobacter sp.]|nr:SDR family oxidoreductase [Fibrobacter sp.]
MKRFSCVVITGASSGIGAALSSLMARRTKHLVLIARRAEKLQSLAQDLRPFCKVTVLVADLSIPEQVAELCDKMDELHIEPTVLVNNAGFGLHGDFSQTDLVAEQQMINVNIHAVTTLTKWAVQSFKLNKVPGTVLNTASIGSYTPGPGMAVYFATKAFVLSFSEALHQELDKYGISVLALCPGYVKSEFHSIAGTNRAGIMNMLVKKSSHDMARTALWQIQNEIPVIVPGFINKLIVFVVRFLPRSRVRKLAEKFL